MANLVVAAVCNLRCPYCFAEQFLHDEPRRTDSVFISPERFEEHLDWLDRSGIDEIRLIGGEPTLHPQFPELIERARRRGKPIMVFSHGLIPEHALKALESLPPQSCTVLVNTNATRHRDQPDAQELGRRRAVIQRLGARALLGFTIYRPMFSLDFLLALIADSGCQRTIRVGLAQPILDGRNAYLHPKQYPLVGSRLVEFARRAAASQVRIDFDCGFVRCMFSDDDLEILRRCGTAFASHCNPILDIDITGQAVHCFPLSEQFRLPAGSGLDAAAMRAALASETRVYRTVGIYQECSTCAYKQSGVCSGGCLGAALRRFHQQSIQVTIPAKAGEALNAGDVQPTVEIHL